MYSTTEDTGGHPIAHCYMEFVLDSGHLHSCFHCTVTFAPNFCLHFGRDICRRDRSGQVPDVPVVLVSHPKTKEALRPKAVVLTVPLFFPEFVNVWCHILTQLLQNLVMFFSLWFTAASC